MLRRYQTTVFAKKLAELFETFTPKSSLQSQPVLVAVHQTLNGDNFANAAPLAATRRRRLRRARSADMNGAVRTAWF